MLRERTKVYKPKGYPFPGTVVARFKTLDGAWRVVVESLRAPGMLHIFSETQLMVAPIELPCPKCRHAWESHETEIKWNEETTLYECTAPMGMGDWCACKDEIPQSIKDEQAEVWS